MEGVDSWGSILAFFSARQVSTRVSRGPARSLSILPIGAAHAGSSPDHFKPRVQYFRSLIGFYGAEGIEMKDCFFRKIQVLAPEEGAEFFKASAKMKDARPFRLRPNGPGYLFLA